MVQQQPGGPLQRPGGAPGQPQPKRTGVALVVGLLALLLVAAAVTIGVILLNDGDDGDTSVTPPTSTSGTPGISGTPGTDGTAGTPDAAQTTLRHPIELRPVLAGGSASGSSPIQSAQSGRASISCPASGITATHEGQRLCLGAPEMTIRSARVQAGVLTGSTTWAVTIGLTPVDTQQFAMLTTRMAGLPPGENQLALYQGGVVLIAPAVVSPITAGELQISGNFSQAQARSLVARITG